MLSVDPPDDDDSDENPGKHSPSAAATTYTIKQRADNGEGDASNPPPPQTPQTNHVGGEGEERKENSDVIMIDGEGDREHNDKESPSVSQHYSFILDKWCCIWLALSKSESFFSNSYRMNV